MSTPLQCSDCSSLNEDGQTRCRGCGRPLGPRVEPEPAVVVTLQRVTGGEIFTAVTGDVPPKLTRTDLFSTHETAPPTALPGPLDGSPQLLTALKERLQRDAEATSHADMLHEPRKGRRSASKVDTKASRDQLRSAIRAFKGRRFDAAVQDIGKALELDDSDPRTWILLGLAHLRLNQPYSAASGYIRALELDPANGSAWLGLSRTFKAAGDSEGSLLALDRAIVVAPGLKEAVSEQSIAQSPPARPKAGGRANPNPETGSDPHRAGARDQGPPTEVGRDRPLNESWLTEEEIVPDSIATGETEIDAEFEDFLKPAQTEKAPPERLSRIRTFVEGLDEALGGGIPRGSVVLIQGAPGTMKSSLGFSVLLNNARTEGLHCLYISLEERAPSLLKQMDSLGLKLRVDRGSVVLLDPRTAKGLLSARSDWIRAFEDALAQVKEERGLDLLVIDSLEALEVMAKFQNHRREMFRLFEWLRDLGVTSFLISERSDGALESHGIQGRWDEDFLSDGVFHLRQHLVSDLEAQRRIRVVKLRGTEHEMGYLALVLDEGRFKVTRAMSP